MLTKVQVLVLQAMIGLVDGMIVTSQLVVARTQLGTQVVSILSDSLKVLSQLHNLALLDRPHILSVVKIADEIQVTTGGSSAEVLKLNARPLELVIDQVLLLHLVSEFIVESSIVAFEMRDIFLAPSHFESQLLGLGEGFTLAGLGVRQHGLLVHETLALTFILAHACFILSVQTVEGSFVRLLHLYELDIVLLKLRVDDTHLSQLGGETVGRLALVRQCHAQIVLLSSQRVDDCLVDRAGRLVRELLILRYDDGRRFFAAASDAVPRVRVSILAWLAERIRARPLSHIKHIAF